MPMTMCFLNGIAESHSIPNTRSIFKDLIIESIPLITLHEIPSARNALGQNPRQEAANGATNEESAKHFHHFAANLVSCHSRGLFLELDRIIAGLQRQPLRRHFQIWRKFTCHFSASWLVKSKRLKPHYLTSLSRSSFKTYLAHSCSRGLPLGLRHLQTGLEAVADVVVERVLL